MEGEQPIRLRRSLALGHDDHTLSPLARTRYFSLGSSSTTTLSATPATLVIRPINSLSLGCYLGSPDEFLLMCRLRLLGIQISFMMNPLLLLALSVFDFHLMIHTHGPRYFLENTLSLLVENLGTEVLFVDAHPVHHFIDEMSLIDVRPPLPVESSINFSMKDIDEGIEEGSEGEHNVKGKGSSGLT
ncbi:hypothetical protein M9H77_29800 [Catharanthus roseus]|uniref:Uncharacterized protein n=1 Tax=Catharanthus roseus TaxID=4058 RepID=A0ACB9ZZP8_CATRO|nr:hypothetical protein M9H77_29800 [Catharanthus roseus]